MIVLDSAEKNRLDLEYSNLLNWRSIVFGGYFAAMAMIAAYLSVLLATNVFKFFIAVTVLGGVAWAIASEVKYRRIADRLKAIEQRIIEMKSEL